jgi:anti-sigma-K factor RskA
MTRSHLISMLSALAAGLVIASSAYAGGEPKHVAPFTRTVAPTNVVSVAGESKRQAPFTRPATRVAVAKQTQAFSWRDASYGAAAVAGLALLIAAVGMTWRARAYKHALGA